MLIHMSPHGSHLSGIRCLVLSLSMLLLPIVGCGSGATRILDSDVPQMPDMEQRLGFDIKRRGGDLVGGVFVFIGPLMDMERSVRVLSSRFRDQGWAVERGTVGFPRSVLVFSMNDRRVEVAIDADQLEPSMSRAQYVVSVEGEGRPVAGDPSTKKDPAASTSG